MKLKLTTLPRIFIRNLAGFLACPPVPVMAIGELSLPAVPVVTTRTPAA